MYRTLTAMVCIFLVGCASGSRLPAPVVDRSGGEARTPGGPNGRAPVTPPSVRTATPDTVTVQPLPSSEVHFGSNEPADAPDSTVPTRSPATTTPYLETAPASESPDSVSRNPAVVALLTDADSYQRGGERARASASLERALRIEPRNARLWHALARVRCAQGRYEDCESLASRSNELGAGDAVEKSNWLLIADARRKRGDQPGADQAARSAERNR